MCERGGVASTPVLLFAAGDGNEALLLAYAKNGHSAIHPRLAVEVLHSLLLQFTDRHTRLDHLDHAAVVDRLAQISVAGGSSGSSLLGLGLRCHLLFGSGCDLLFGFGR